MPDGFVDLDELILQCRGDAAREAIREAVAAYRAGAYRAAIIATWMAVVFDYFAKLRDLDVGGHCDASAFVRRLEKARVDDDKKASLQIENDLLDEAKTKFELLTPIEYDDLVRLQNDRHRCAHPSLNSLEEPYQPSAEAVRLHLRNAVMHMLSRPPLQGKEAYAALWREVTSEFFSTKLDDAVARLRLRLVQARETVVRQVLVELTKKLLEPLDATSSARFPAGTISHPRPRTALMAIVELRRDDAHRLFREKLPKLADVNEVALPRLVEFCRHAPIVQDHLDEPTRNLLRTRKRDRQNRS